MWRICFGRRFDTPPQDREGLLIVNARHTKLDMIIKDNMEIVELKNYTQAQFEDLKLLMSELSDRVNFTQTDLMLVLKDSNCHLYVILESLTSNPSSSTKLRTGAGERRIIGCATLCVFHSPTGTKASIEDVVVSSAYRGQYLGKQLMEYVLEQAKAYAPIVLHLTSNPMRVAANHLYQSLGFQRKETNCYQMSIVDGTTVQDNQKNLKQSITYLIGKERAEGNLEPITPHYVSRVLNVPLEEVEKCMKEMEV